MALKLRLFLLRKVGFGAFALAPICAPPVDAHSTFTSMVGAWSGNGTVHLRGGTQERIRCRASYDPSSSGQSLKLELPCASDVWNFDLTGSVVQNGISISGTWFESVNRVGGRITGQVQWRLDAGKGRGRHRRRPAHPEDHGRASIVRNNQGRSPGSAGEAAKV